LGVTKYAIDNNRHDVAFIKENTNSPCLLRVDVYPYALFSVDSTSPTDYTGETNLWEGVKTYSVRTTGNEIKPWIEVPPEERVLEWEGTGPSGEQLKTVFSVLKEICDNYDAQEVSRITGLSVSKFNEIADTFTSLKPGTVTYAMGLTQHTNGAQLLRN
jgi:formate dehydrogenase major subunit